MRSEEEPYMAAIGLVLNWQGAATNGDHVERGLTQIGG